MCQEEEEEEEELQCFIHVESKRISKQQVND
jgi:hypothetical protein